MGNLTVKENGEMVNFISPNVSNITSFKVHFSPKQEGEGDPSPENIREITGWNGVEGYISNVAQSYSSTSNTLTATIDWTEDVGTMYGGYVDLISGELVQEYYKFVYNGKLPLSIRPTSNDNISIITHRDLAMNSTIIRENNSPFFCNYCKSYDNLPIDSELTFWIGAFTSTNWFRIYVPSSLGSTSDEINAYFIEHPFEICYKATSQYYRTYQLTPQQLSTLKGQNNFWSNADYIEIEYELTETFDIQKAKRKIILNQPHVESASGDLVTFDTDMKGKLKECKVYFSPVQEGEGDPSPDNVRNIVGWSWAKLSTAQQNIYGNTKNILRKIYIPAGTTWTVSCDGGGTVYIYDADKKIQNSWAINNIDEISGRHYKTITVSSYDIYYVRIVGNKCQNPQFEFGVLSKYEPVIENSITFPSDIGTVYGGYVDLVSGELVQEYSIFDLETTVKNIQQFSSFKMWFSDSLSTLGIDLTPSNNSSFSGYCDAYPILPYGTNAQTIDYNVSVRSDGNRRAIYVRTDGTSDIKPIGNIVLKLETPITYQLTPQQLTTLRGINNIWSSANGEVEIKYWKH